MLASVTPAKPIDGLQSAMLGKTGPAIHAEAIGVWGCVLKLTLTWFGVEILRQDREKFGADPAGAIASVCSLACCC
ncbi:MAG: hypothetical protein EA001_16050 [Oscillatoriales cyanobacterium]|nr:MAG: hypothetical protein EA001_16050 [Oscillatoriales cyanobacterium]